MTSDDVNRDHPPNKKISRQIIGDTVGLTWHIWLVQLNLWWRIPPERR